MTIGGLLVLLFGLSVATAFVIFKIVVPIVLLLIVVLCCAAGAFGDWLHHRRVAKGKAQWRLPFYYRWKGWRVGSLRPEMAGYGWKSGICFDRKRNRFIPMVRPIHSSERDYT